MKTKAKAHEILIKNNIFFSRGEMRRAIAQNAVSINGVKVEDIEQEFEIGTDVAIQKGRRKFLNSQEWFSNEIDPVKIALFGRLKDNTPQSEIDAYEKFTGRQYFPEHWQ